LLQFWRNYLILKLFKNQTKRTSKKKELPFNVVIQKKSKQIAWTIFLIGILWNEKR
jgi:hypothetical protein